MGDESPEVVRREREAAAKVTERILALELMSLEELLANLRELFGFETHCTSKIALRKRLAWRVQEIAFGGLSPRAIEKIEELSRLAPARWCRPREHTPRPESPKRHLARSSGEPADAGPRMRRARDPRIPPVGAVIPRPFGGVVHCVTVLEKGFEYKGQRHGSLSEIARIITGQSWNGYLFFGLGKRERAGGYR